MEDLKKSFSKAIEERMTSPLFGAFILSWLTCNWRVIYMLLFSGSDYTTLVKMGFAKIFIKEHSYLYSFWLPIVITFFIVSLYPALSNLVFKLSEYYADRRIKIRHKYIDTQLLSLEASIELRRELFYKDKEFNEILSGYVTKLNESSDEKTKLNTGLSEANVKINSLKEANDTLKSENTVLSDSVEKINADLSVITEQRDIKSLYLHHRDELLRNGYKDAFPMIILASNLSHTDRVHLLSLPTTHNMSEQFLKEKFGDKSFDLLRQEGVFILNNEKLILSPQGFALLMILKGMELGSDIYNTETERL